MDTLSEVLALLKSHRTLFAGLKAGGTWAVNFPAPEGIKFNAVVEGKCWLEVEGEPVPIALSEGDCFLLTHTIARGDCRATLHGRALTRATYTERRWAASPAWATPWICF